MLIKNNEIMITKRADGSLVGREVSRQRRWQLRNPEKSIEIQKRYTQSEKGKELRKRYSKMYFRRKKNEKKLSKIGRFVLNNLFSRNRKRSGVKKVNK